MNHSRTIIVSLLVFILYCSGFVKAGIETVNNQISGSQIIHNGFVLVQDNNYPDVELSGAAKVASASGKVIFSIDNASPLYFSTSNTVKLGLVLSSYDKNGVAQTLPGVVELEVGYSPTGSYKDKSVYVISGSHKLSAKIQYIKDGSNVTIPTASIPQNLRLEVEQSSERYYSLNTYTAPTMGTATLLAPSNELDIHWDVQQGAEEYELEWTYANNYSATGGELPTDSVFCDFKNNSTRVRIGETHYPVSLLFDQGYIVYRVRGIGRSFSNTSKELFGIWSAAESNVILYYSGTDYYHIDSTARHEKAKNWQYSASYAEEGKKKEVVSYFDGSLRNRQSVTKLNTDKKTIVGETIYDYQGRGAVQVLPTPTSESTIKFYPDFNKSTASGLPDYSRKDFDEDSVLSPCTTPTLGMSTTTGSSNYYSSANPDTAGVQAYVPDAKLYPFSQVEYTPDNTGRIRRQSGVGEDHRLGTRHETKYFYGQPEQVQLDRLFGSEVGDYQHYKKNMVIDANGQVSVSYLDEKGKVIATSLAGDTLVNLNTLKNVPSPTSLTINYLKAGDSLVPNSNVTQDNSLVFSKELIVTSDENYDFYYDMEAPHFQDSCLPSPICYDCIYDLEVSVTDACGTPMFTPVKKQVGSIDTTCSGTITFSLDSTSALTPISVTLPVGTYTVSKKLTISETAIDYYTTNFIKNNTCIKPYQTFLDSALTHIDTTQCEISCDQCAARLGGYSSHSDTTKGYTSSPTYDPNYEYMTLDAYNKALKECKAPCQPTNLCESEYQTLLSDVSPGGQYAKYTIDSITGVASSSDPLSVFNSGNFLPDRSAACPPPSSFSYWRNPKRTIHGTTTYRYYEEDGSVSKITVTLQPDGTYYPEVASIACYHDSIRTNPVDSSLYIYPEELAKESDFINLFESHPDWAKSLVEYHPEYPYYKWCIDNSDTLFSEREVPASSGTFYTSDGFDDLLRSKNTAASAASASLTASGLPNLISQDPYFNLGSPSDGKGTAQKTAMLAVLGNYNGSGLSLDSVCAQTARCGTMYYGTPSGCGPFGSSASTAVKDQEWVLYRNIYLAEKQKFQQMEADAYASSSMVHRYNGCIGSGSGSYNPWASGPFSWSSSTEPCGTFTWFLYRDKTKRFQSANDAMQSLSVSGDPQTALDALANNANYTTYLQTGQCPVTTDLGYLLDNLAQHSQLVASSTEIGSNPAFTKKLYDQVAPSFTSYIDYYWVPTVSDSTLSVKFREGSSGSMFDGCSPGNSYKLNLTLHGGYSWSDVIHLSAIQFTSESPTGTYNFTINAYIDSNTSDTIPAVLATVTGHTCMQLNGCSFSNNCGPSATALDLQNVFNALISQSQLGSSNVNLAGSPYGGLFANHILLPAGDTFTSIKWNPGLIPGYGYIDDTLSDHSHQHCSFHFSFVNPGHSMSDILYFANVKPDPGNVHGLLIDAWVGDHFEPMTVANTEGCYNFETCTPPANLQCTGPEYKPNLNFIAGLNTIANQNRLLTDCNILGMTDFAALYTTGNYLEWDFYSKNDTTKNLVAYVDKGAPGSCKITMKFADTTDTHHYSDITGFANLQVPSSGNGSVFTMLAVFSDGANQLLNCTTECFQLAVCEQCTQTTTGDTLVTMDFDSFNSLSPGFTSDRSYDASCNFSIYPTVKYHVEANVSTDCSVNYYSATGTDHTNPGTGLFLINNFEEGGSPEALWQITVGSIIPYTDYVFSYWIQRCNPVTGREPVWSAGNLQMEIAGTDYTTSIPATSSAWQQVSRTWNSGSNTSVTLKIIASLSTGVLGIDDILFTQTKTIPCPVTQANPSTIPVLTYVNPCVQNLKDIAAANALASYNFYIDSVKNNFRNRYVSYCKNPLENMKIVYTDNEYHITLYYYDQAGNLVRTVPPEGVVMVTSPTDLAQIANDRLHKTHTFFTQHTLITRYEYNSLNQLLRQAVPDNDLMNKWELNGASSIPSGTNIYGMAFSSNNNGFVVGDDGSGHGVVYNTINGGTSWSLVSSLGIDNLEDIQFAGITGYAIAQPGYLVKTVNGGSTWNVVATPVSQQLNDLHFFDANNGIVIGKNGTILTTSTGGSSWMPVTGFSADLNDIQFLPSPSTTGFIVGNAGTVLISTNSGTSWTALGSSPLSTALNLNAVHFLSSNRGYLTGVNTSTHQGVIVKYGQTSPAPTYGWIPQLATAANATVFAALNMNAAGKGYAGGSNGVMYSTADSGSTWAVQPITGFTAGITEMDFPDNTGHPDIGYATTTNGKLLKLDTTAHTWNVLNTPVSTGLNGLYFSTTDTGYVAGNGGIILKTPNSGTSWTSLTTVNFDELNDACFAAGSTTVGYAVGKNGAIIKTSNGGTSWSTVTNANTTELNAVYFKDTNTGIMVGNGGLIITTSNGGSSLSTPSSGTGNNLNDIVHASSKWITVGDNHTVLYSSTGSSWTGASISSGTEELYSVYFVGTVGYTCGSNGVVFKTANDGVTWAATAGSTGTTETLREVYFKDYLSGYVMGDNGTIIKTIDGGAHWTTEAGIAGENFQTAHFNEDGHALLAGTGTTNLGNLDDESFDHSSRFWYDRLGRMVVSQNSKQFNKSPKAYSYTVYDALGRITQVGETGTATDIATLANEHGVIGDDAAFSTWLSGGTHTEVTSTLYDVAIATPIAGFTQENLRSRVSSVRYEDVEDNNPATFQFASCYDYDVHGNVQSLVQDNPRLSTVSPSQEYKRIDYIYDLVSGKVNQVSYQDGKPDAFYHKYEYDADNRITNVITSKDGVIWDNDANYFYYKHGPLARTELGDLKVQAMDYAYTIQGWIKGVNSNTLVATRDIGKDGDTASFNVNKNIGRDAFGYSLNYFNNDYKSIGSIAGIKDFIASTTSNTNLTADAPNLYNGNIKSMVTAINDLTTPTAPVVKPQLTAYRYDQLNRIAQMKAYRDINLSTNVWGSGSGYDGSYETHLTYDANGNIETLKRNGDASVHADMDNMTYKYENLTNGYTRNTNKLRQVTDAVSSSNYATDIDNQSSNNYDYDEIGNLKSDAQEEIAGIDWTVYGKIKKITRTGGSSKPDLEFKYDASGNRIAKIVKPHATLGDSTTYTTTYYVRDAAGNVLSTYELEDTTYTLKEQMLYGSSRLGVMNRDLDLTASAADTVFTRTLGKKNLELNNHLGNVLSVVSDRRLPHSTSGTAIDYYLADIQSSTDYGVWGDPLPMRNFSSSSYRYGFNGKEKTDEISGNGNQYDYGFRIYNPRLGRFLSVDPLTSKYAFYTPYQFAGNKPINSIDLDGLEEWNLSNGNTFVKTFYGPYSNEYLNNVEKKLNQIENSRTDGQCVLEEINSKEIKVELPYPVVFDSKQISNVPIEYDEKPHPNIGGEVKDNHIYIYEAGMDYQSKTTSVLLHEYVTHYTEGIVNVIPSESPAMEYKEETNELYGTDIDPFKTPTIKVLHIGESPDILKEEINGHTLQLQLNENGAVPLSDKDVKAKETVLTDYKDELKAVYDSKAKKEDTSAPNQEEKQ